MKEYEVTMGRPHGIQLDNKQGGRNMLTGKNHSSYTEFRYHTWHPLTSNVKFCNKKNKTKVYRQVKLLRR